MRRPICRALLPALLVSQECPRQHVHVAVACGNVAHLGCNLRWEVLHTSVGVGQHQEIASPGICFCHPPLVAFRSTPMLVGPLHDNEAKEKEVIGQGCRDSSSQCKHVRWDKRITKWRAQFQENAFTSGASTTSRRMRHARPLGLPQARHSPSTQGLTLCVQRYRLE